MLFLALRMGRPLFLEGEAGVGKTEIAKVLAATLGRRLIRLQCYEGLDVAAAVYEWNYAAQMIAIRLAEAEGSVDRERLAHDVFSERFLIKRPLLQALEPDPAGAPVLLIDELDRTDEAFEAFLLEVLADFQVTIPELGTVKAAHPPIVDHHLEPHARNPRRAQAPLPLSLGRLSDRRARTARSCAPRCRASPRSCRSEVVHFVQALRKEDLFKSPGVAETLDWAAALTELDVVALDPATVSDTLGVLLKYQDDIARIEGTQGEGAARRRCARSCGRRSERAVSRRRATGRLAENIVYFARALRAAGIPVGPGAVLDALDAVQAAGVGTREDFYWTLHAVFVKRHEHSVLFDQAFRIFFRKRAYLDKLIAMLLAAGAGRRADEPPQAGAQRVQEALFSGMNDRKPPEEREIELDARLTVSDREVLQKKDFAQMSAAEIARPRTRSSGWCCRSTR